MALSSASNSFSEMSSLTKLRPSVAELQQIVIDFVEHEVIPAEEEYKQHMENRFGSDRWSMDAIPSCLIRLQSRAKQLGLWNLFLPEKFLPHVPKEYHPKIPVSESERDSGRVEGLSYREYGILCESLGRSPELAPQACNSSAPDTGNMEVLLEFGSTLQKQQYLIPLLKGEIRSTFLMTEPQVASSDPTNLETTLSKRIQISPDGTQQSVSFILSGRKWWSTGAMDPRCRVAVVVAKMDYSHPSCQQEKLSSTERHNAHTIVLVPLPHPNVTMVRPLTVFGYDDAPFGHAEVLLDNVPILSNQIVLGEGKGFLISQARLGPGRIHHCMRAIGMAARSYELLLQRTFERKTFGKYLYEHGSIHERIADCKIDLELARTITLSCAALLDDHSIQMTGQNHFPKEDPYYHPRRREIRNWIAMIKVTVPELTYRIVDQAVQVYGGAGACEDFVLARFLVALRTLRIADGPDAVHKQSIALMELKKAATSRL